MSIKTQLKKLTPKKISISLILIILFLIFLKISISYKLESDSSLKIYDRHNQLLFDVRDEYRQTNYQNLDEVPPFLKEFLTTKEDQRFYQHRGIDFRAIWRAILSKIKWQSLQWASTIDQQVIKISQEAFAGRSISQKIKENILALNINLRYSKDEIFLYYLNNIHFPKWVKWYESACQVYFQSTCADLSQGHLIYLYARSRFPSKKSIVEYANKIENKYYDKYDISVFQDIEAEEWFYIQNTARRYVEYILSKQSKKTKNKKIETSFDSELFYSIQSSLDQYQPYLASKNAHNACVIVLENGDIASMNVLQKHGDSYINPCTSTRQVWSAIKPFVYLLAFDQLQYNGNTKVIDEAISFESDYWFYAPQNFDLQYHWEVTLSTALWSSLNIPAVKLAHQLWVWNLYSFYKQISYLVGAETTRNDDINDLGLTIALWVKWISPLDFTRMRQIFNSDFCSSSVISTEVEKSLCNPYEKELTEIRTILSQNHNRIIWFPINNRFDVANSYGKSWTSRHFIDWWICWWKNQYTVCIRVGNLSTDPMRTSWHDIVWPIWYEIMQKL